jgi:PAS domain S-box-containing protein
LNEAEQRRERQRQLTLLRESEARLERVLQSVPDVLFSMSADLSEVSYVSPAATPVVGFTPQEFIADASLWLRRVEPNDVALVKAAFARARRGESTNAQFRMTHRDDSVRWLDATFVPVRNAQGEVGRIDGVARDVTEARQLETQLRQAQKMEVVGQLAGGIAHDFNNMLVVILGWAEISLAEASPGDPLREALTEIQNAGQAASNLTRQLLAFSRHQLVEPTIVDVNEVVAGADKMLGKIIGKHIKLRSRATAAIGTVKIDRGQLEQVVMNLVVNARDAMPSGGEITIETDNVLVGAAPSQAMTGVVPGQYVRLSVLDTGTGMSDAVRAHIFEPFFTTKERDKGTGLGLSTCYGIAKQAGGNIVVASQEGVGTTMTVYLPRCEASPTVQHPALGALARGVGTILLVQDDPAVHRVTARILEAQGYRVLSASSGPGALRMIEDGTEPVDLLLTDVVLAGGMNGVALAERVRGQRPSLPILFASGYTSDVSLVHGLLERGVTLAQKPFTAESLGAKVREALRSTGLAR